MSDLRTQQKEIDELLRSLNNPKANNDPVLKVNQDEMMRGKNNGYPLNMYHHALDPVTVFSREQEAAIAAKGYVRNYIPKQYPKVIYRRNLHDPRYKVAGAVEDRTVKSAEEEAALRKLKPPQGCSQWVDRVGELQPLEETTEDHAVTIARLEGELTALRGNKK